jgi:hypothetical protein
MRWILVNIASATGLLKCCGHAAPMMRDVHVVSVISAAPCAILLPSSHISLMRGYSVSRKKYQTVARLGTTFG